MRFFGLLIIVVFGVGLINSCSEETINPTDLGTIEGTVLRRADDLPLEGAEVSTSPTTSVVFSDSLGEFTIIDVPAGDYTVTVQADNFRRTFGQVSVSKDATAEVTLKMERSSIVPEPSTNPIPENNQDSLALNVTLQWDAIDPTNDTVTFDVFLYESNVSIPKTSAVGISDTFLTVTDLQFSTTYFWQVNTKTTTGGEAKGDVWTFSTQTFPDNRYAYISRPEGNAEIFTSDETGQNRVRISFTNFENLSPRFNRDRSLIAFTSNIDFNQNIYIMSPDGSNVLQVTNIPVAGFHSKGSSFSWASDYGQFIYAHYDKLYRIDRNGSNLTQIATAPEARNFRDMDWNDISRRVVMETVGTNPYDGEIYYMDIDSLNMIPLVDSLPGSLGTPSFSVDGQQVLYTYDISGLQSADGRQLDTHIFIIDIESGTTIDLSAVDKPSGTNDLEPRFSPDGSKIIFVNTLNDGSSPRAIYIMDVDGTDRELLFENAENPEWR